MLSWKDGAVLGCLRALGDVRILMPALMVQRVCGEMEGKFQSLFQTEVNSVLVKKG